MTCIVGLVADSKVYVGGDSAAIGGLEINLRSDEKVFYNGAYLIGFAGSFRMGQLLRYRFKPPVRRPDQGLYSFMVNDFVDAVRDCLKDGGYARRSNDAESGGFFLVAVEGRLFEIEADYQVAEPLERYYAIGCGAQVALGALAATEDKLPVQRVIAALEASAKHNAGVRGPFVIEVLEGSASDKRRKGARVYREGPVGTGAPTASYA